MCPAFVSGIVIGDAPVSHWPIFSFSQKCQKSLRKLTRPSSVLVSKVCRWNPTHWLCAVLRMSPQWWQNTIDMIFFMNFFLCGRCWQVSIESDNVMPMEMLPINNNGGQGYGFILYRTELWKEPWQITIHDISDSAQVTTRDALRKCIRSKKEGRSNTRSY